MHSTREPQGDLSYSLLVQPRDHSHGSPRREGSSARKGAVRRLSKVHRETASSEIAPESLATWVNDLGGRTAEGKNVAEHLGGPILHSIRYDFIFRPVVHANVRRSGSCDTIAADRH
jgi:hypothetical protein